MIIKDSFLRDMAKLVAWYPLRWFITLAPWSATYTLGRLVGRIDNMRSHARRDTVAANIRGALGDSVDEADAHSAALRIIQRHYIEHMEFYKFATLNRNNIGQHLAMEGIENLDRALERGKGAILVHMHFGSKQFPLVGLGLSGYTVNQVGYRDPEAEDYSFIHKNVHLRIRMHIEDRFKAKHIHVNKSLRPLYNALAKNEVVMITGDGIGGIRGHGDNYIPVRFLGKTMMFPPGPARIARRTGAALIPLFCVQTDHWRYRAIFEEPVDIAISDDRLADARVNTERYAAVFERYVRAHPDHWMFWEEFQPGYLLKS